MARITEFIKEGKTLYDVLALWYESMGHEETESIFDLDDRRDRTLFRRNHGFWKTRRYRRKSRYWIDGCNFRPEAHQGLEGPLAVDDAWMASVINDEVLDYIKRDMALGWNISYWGEVLDMNKLRLLLV